MEFGKKIHQPAGVKIKLIPVFFWKFPIPPPLGFLPKIYSPVLRNNIMATS
jgi:hypothetical protein